jgi:hypothetical protein
MNLTIKKERSQKQKDKQARKCHEENTDVTQTTSNLSSACGNRPSGTRRLPQRHCVYANEHLVNTGYLDAKLLVESQRDYHLDLVGLTRKDYRWQASQQTGFAAEHFLIDWDKQQATCPERHTSNSWTPAIDKRKNEVIKIKFSTTDCRGKNASATHCHSCRFQHRSQYDMV